MKAYASVWDAIKSTPAEVARMKACSEMMYSLQTEIAGWNLTQSAAAKLLGVTQPRLNDLLKGRLSKFSMDALFELASVAGMEPTVTVHGTVGKKSAGGRISRTRGSAARKQVARPAKPRRQAPKGLAVIA